MKGGRSVASETIHSQSEPGDLNEQVAHPDYYGGGDDPYEAIKVIAAFGHLEGFALGSVIKYVRRFRSGKGKPWTNLRKAAWYLNYFADYMERQTEEPQAECEEVAKQALEALEKDLLSGHEAFKSADGHVVYCREFGCTRGADGAKGTVCEGWCSRHCRHCPHRRESHP